MALQPEQTSGLKEELKFLEINGMVLLVKEGDETICKLKAPDSKFSTVRVLEDAANSTMLKVKKNHLSVHNEWTAFDSDDTVLYNFSKKKFQKHTFIHVCPILPSGLPALLVEPEVSLPSLGAPLLISSDRVAPVPSLEGAQENMIEYREFDIKGSWSGKDCVMRVTGSETIIAQMLPLDNNTEGFVVRFTPHINREFVATCFAAVYAMKSESRKRKNVVSAGGKMLGAAAFASSKCIYDCASGGC